jgi:hypothetical protein
MTQFFFRICPDSNFFQKSAIKLTVAEKGY